MNKEHFVTGAQTAEIDTHYELLLMMMSISGSFKASLPVRVSVLF